MNIMMHHDNDDDDNDYRFNYYFKRIEERLALNCWNTSEINLTLPWTEKSKAPRSEFMDELN